MRRELITWNEVHQLVDHLMVQFEHEFQAMLIITRGGIVPGGLLAEANQVGDADRRPDRAPVVGARLEREEFSV